MSSSPFAALFLGRTFSGQLNKCWKEIFSHSIKLFSRPHPISLSQYNSRIYLELFEWTRCHLLQTISEEKVNQDFSNPRSQIPKTNKTLNAIKWNIFCHKTGHRLILKEISFAKCYFSNKYYVCDNLLLTHKFSLIALIFLTQFYYD